MPDNKKFQRMKNGTDIPLDTHSPKIHARVKLAALTLATVALLQFLNACALPPSSTATQSESGDVVYDARNSARGTATGSESGLNESARTAKSETVLQNGRVHLGRCLEQALRYNLDVSIAKLESAAARSRITSAEAEFDPAIGGSIAAFPDAGGDTSANAVLHKKFITGTDLRMEAGTVAYDSTDRTAGRVSNQTDYALRIRQPLLRGAGIDANSTGIRMARVIAKNADATSEAQIIEMLRAGESIYWTASYASHLLQSQKDGLARAEKVLELVNTRKEAGAATKIDVLEAEAALASARDAVGRANKHYLDSVAMLWQIAGFEVREPESGYVFAGLTEARTFSGKPNPEESYRKASHRSPTAVLIANQVQMKSLQVDKAKNNLLPRLDLEFNVGTGDLFSFQRVTSTPTGSSSTTTGNYNVLLRFTVPWISRAERSELQAARIELEKSELARIQAFRELKRQIFETCRTIDSERQHLEAASYGARVNRAKWEEQFRRYQEGVVSVRDLMEAEGAFRQSEANELEARLRLILAGILLSRQEGTLPERNNFVL